MKFKDAWDRSIDNATEIVKENKVVTGIITGGVVGTILFPIPIIGTVLGAVVGAKIAEKIEKENGELKMKKTVVVEIKGNQPDLFLATDVDEEDVKVLTEFGVKVAEVEVEEDTNKKKTGLIIPVVGAIWASLPSTATVIGAGVIGVVGGAASIVGGRIIHKIWPDKKPSE